MPTVHRYECSTRRALVLTQLVAHERSPTWSSSRSLDSRGLVKADRPRGLVRRRSLRLVGLVGATVVLFAVALCSVAVGAKSIPFGTVLEPFTTSTRANDHLIVRSLRVPRTVVGLLVGAALGVGGRRDAGRSPATRSPTPASSASTPAPRCSSSSAIYCFGLTSLLGYVWFAFAGAARRLGGRLRRSARSGREGATPVKLALAGAALTALLGSITTAILLLDVDTLDQFRFWAVGSLAGRDGDDRRQRRAVHRRRAASSPWPAGRLLNTLALGDDVARVARPARRAARAFSAPSCIVLLCGAATAAAGPIAFVGLAVPHVARAITGPDYRWILPYSMVLGAVAAARRRRHRPRRRPARRGAGRHRHRAHRRAVLHRPRPPPQAGGARDRVDGDRRCSDVTPADASSAPAPRHGARRTIASSIVLAVAHRRRRSACRSASATSRSRSATSSRRSSATATTDAEFIVRTLRLPRALTGRARRRRVRAVRRDLPEPRPQPAGQPRHHRHRRRRQRGRPCSCIVVARRGSTAGHGVGALVGALRRRGRDLPPRVEAGRVAATGWCSSASASPPCSSASRRTCSPGPRSSTPSAPSVWLTGSLNGRGWDHVRPLGIADARAGPGVVAAARGRCACCSSATTPPRASACGVERVAAGARARRRRASPRSATAAAGPIVFVAFVAAADRPPAHRRPARRSCRAALVGALLRARCRTSSPGALFAPTELPVGVVTGVVGAPYLLWLLARANRVGRGG